jgi:hypothetical protein
MKKLVLFFAVVLAVSFASCGNKKAEVPAEEPATEQVAVEEAPAAEPAVADSTAAAPAEETAPVAE